MGAPTFLLKIVAAAVVCATMLLAIHEMGKKARRCSADALEWGRTLRVPRDGDGGRPRARAEWTSSTCWTVQLGSEYSLDPREKGLLAVFPPRSLNSDKMDALE